MPKVSIIIPCFNEQATIGATLDAIYAQSYSRADIEVVVADAMSTDRTRGVITEFSQAHSELLVRVVDNQLRFIPAGLNRAIESARGDVIVRMDAHAKPYPDYVENCVKALQANKGDNVGGVWEIQPGGPGWLAAGIAVAAAHPLGAGDAAYRLKPEAGAVDTVPFGAYHKSLVEKIGVFDESLLANEDYEFNARVREAGGVVWLDPGIRSIYYARPDLAGLARQYARYGFWKWRMLARYPRTIRWRQWLPPLFVAGFILLAFLSLFVPVAQSLLAAQLGIYSLALVSVALMEGLQKKSASLFLSVPLALMTMHFAWGGGFLWSMLSSLFGVWNG